MSVSGIKIVEFHQKQGGQLVSANELTSDLIGGGSIPQFHDTLPDELQRVLASFAIGNKNAYLNALKSQLNTEKTPERRIWDNA